MEVRLDRRGLGATHFNATMPVDRKASEPKVPRLIKAHAGSVHQVGCDCGINGVNIFFSTDCNSGNVGGLAHASSAPSPNALS